MAALKAGRPALDAVEAGVREVESDAADHSVGLGGYPNLLGDVEQDASIMDGRTLLAGAVAALKGYPHAISVARKVMEMLPHVLLVGEGATRFAGEMGFTLAELRTPDAMAAWRERLLKAMPLATFETLHEARDLAHWVYLASDPERAGGTTNFIALDAEGNLASGVSTSGWFAKYPGRVGDSPIIGAGNYADNRYGAATCTGMGEMALRAGAARSVVLYLKTGMTVDAAVRQAMLDLNDLGGDYLDSMSILALDREGAPAGFTNLEQGEIYWMLTDTMTAPAQVIRTFVQTHKRWGKR